MVRECQICSNSECIIYCGKVYKEETLKKKVLCKINKLVPVVLFPSKSTIHLLLNKFQIGCLLQKKQAAITTYVFGETSEYVATVRFSNRSYLEVCMVKSILGYRILEMIFVSLKRPSKYSK